MEFGVLHLAVGGNDLNVHPTPMSKTWRMRNELMKLIKSGLSRPFPKLNSKEYVDLQKKTDMVVKYTYKARLVAKGCTQTYAGDYETDDVKTAFLNGRLDEDIYMEQPEGYVNPKYPNHGLSCMLSECKADVGICSKLGRLLSTGSRESSHWVSVMRSWPCDKNDTKSRRGYVFVVNGGAHCNGKPFWVRKFVGDLGE
ncbi:hypothetical protein Tco_1166893 [Tanacetum coccineum]